MRALWQHRGRRLDPEGVPIAGFYSWEESTGASSWIRYFRTGGLLWYYMAMTNYSTGTYCFIIGRLH